MWGPVQVCGRKYVGNYSHNRVQKQKYFSIPYESTDFDKTVKHKLCRDQCASNRNDKIALVKAEVWQQRIKE